MGSEGPGQVGAEHGLVEIPALAIEGGEHLPFVEIGSDQGRNPGRFSGCKTGHRLRGNQVSVHAGLPGQRAEGQAILPDQAELGLDEGGGRQGA